MLDLDELYNRQSSDMNQIACTGQCLPGYLVEAVAVAHDARLQIWLDLHVIVPTPDWVASSACWNSTPSTFALLISRYVDISEGISMLLSECHFFLASQIRCFCIWTSAPIHFTCWVSRNSDRVFVGCDNFSVTSPNVR